MIKMFHIVTYKLSEKFCNSESDWCEINACMRNILDKRANIFWSGSVGKHFSCIINVAIRNLFTVADISTHRTGRVCSESDSRKLVWIADFMTNTRTTNFSHTKAFTRGSFLIRLLVKFYQDWRRNISWGNKKNQIL